MFTKKPKKGFVREQFVNRGIVREQFAKTFFKKIYKIIRRFVARLLTNKIDTGVQNIF